MFIDTDPKEIVSDPKESEPLVRVIVPVAPAVTDAVIVTD